MHCRDLNNCVWLTSLGSAKNGCVSCSSDWMIWIYPCCKDINSYALVFWIQCYMKGQTRHFQKSLLAELISEFGMLLNDVDVRNNLTGLELISYLHSKEFHIKENRFEQDEKKPSSLIHIPYGSVPFRTPSDSSEITSFKEYLQGCELRCLKRCSCTAWSPPELANSPLQSALAGWATSLEDWVVWCKHETLWCQELSSFIWGYQSIQIILIESSWSNEGNGGAMDISTSEKKKWSKADSSAIERF